MPRGFGTMKFGVSPLGFGTGDDAPLPPTGAWGSRYINPQTGDYANDPATGQLQQMPAVRQRFLLRLKERRGSSSVRPNDGIVLPTKIDDSIQSTMDDAVRLAMHQETDVEKVARIDFVRVERDSNNTGRVLTIVSFVDLTTGLADQVSF